MFQMDSKYLVMTPTCAEGVVWWFNLVDVKPRISLQLNGHHRSVYGWIGGKVTIRLFDLEVHKHN